MKKQLSSHQFPSVYQDLGIDLGKLGCVMADLEPIVMPDWMAPDSLYVTNDPTKFWIDGWVARKTPHVTVLYGLMQPAWRWRENVLEVTKGWSLPSVRVEKVGFFDSPYESDPYYCIVAHVETSPALLEGHHRLQMLPHIDTFAGYRPHFTLAYIAKAKGEAFRDRVIRLLNREITGKTLKVKPELNLGGDK